MILLLISNLQNQSLKKKKRNFNLAPLVCDLGNL